MHARLIPELDVSDLQVSLRFYLDLIGFQLSYQRPEERFARLNFEGAELMLQEATGPGRRFRTASLEKPFGRGVNFQIQSNDTDKLYERVLGAGKEIVIPLEEIWYRAAEHELGNKQFVLADPDGYLLRFFTDLGSRPCASTR